MRTEAAYMPRDLFFLAFAGITLLAFFAPLRELASFTFGSDVYSYVVLIPAVSGYFLFTVREKVARDARYAPAYGIPVVAMGALLYYMTLSRGGGLGKDDYLFLTTLSALTVFVGGFLALYGTRALKAASFPLMLLIFMVPMPGAMLEWVVGALQRGSTESAYAVLKLTGVPVAREGFTFYFSSLSVQVAEECSGIHSGISLFITAVIAAHLFLAKGSRKAVLLAAVLPITVFKNGLRIVTLSLLGVYVDQRVLDSQLHRKGGIPFFLLALLLLGAVLWLLRKSERGVDIDGGKAGKKA